MLAYTENQLPSLSKLIEVSILLLAVGTQAQPLLNDQLRLQQNVLVQNHQTMQSSGKMLVKLADGNLAYIDPTALSQVSVGMGMQSMGMGAQSMASTQRLAGLSVLGQPSVQGPLFYSQQRSNYGMVSWRC